MCIRDRFIQAIPYNFYALLTIVMMLGLILFNVDFGPMAKFERNAIEKGDLFSAVYKRQVFMRTVGPRPGSRPMGEGTPPKISPSA